MSRKRDRELYNLEDLTDDELRQLVLDQFREHPNLGASEVDVVVIEGHVTLTGRVGTDGEVQVATALLDDVLGLERYTNDLVVDEIMRGTLPLATDDVLGGEEEVEEPLGGSGSQQSDTAEHLVEDLEADTFGTRDMGKAIQGGNTYIPPDHPVSDGYGSREEH